LTESGLERLLKIKQLTLNSETIHLESIKLRSAEITNLDGSKPPRVNSDSFQIKGSFTSTKFLPIAVGQVYLNDDDTYYLSNTSTVIRGNDGTYDFNIKAQFATSTPGSYKIDLGVRFDARANAWFRLGTVEFEAK
jgi:hypothetical protein